MRDVREGLPGRLSHQETIYRQVEHIEFEKMKDGVFDNDAN